MCPLISFGFGIGELRDLGFLFLMILADVFILVKIPSAL